MNKLERSYWEDQLELYEEQYKEACYIKKLSLREAIRNIKHMLDA